MKPIRNLIRTIVLAAAIAAGFGLERNLNAAITPAFEYTTASVLNDSRDFTLGFKFTLSAPVTINALAYWVDGRPLSHQVGIWNSVGTLLTSTTVQASDPVQGHFWWHSIPSYTLNAGTYTIGGQFLGGGTFPDNAQGVTTIPGYTWLDDVQQIGSGLNYPTASASYGNNGIAVVNFSAVPVPEPSTYLAGALLALVFGVQGFRTLRYRKTA